MAIKTVDIQVGLSSTTSNNFVFRAPDDGTLRISRGVLGTTTDAVAVDKNDNFVIYKGVVETANILATAPTAGVNTYNVITNGFVYHTANATTNFTLNIVGANLITVGQAITMTFAMSNGSTGYYPNTLTLDGTTTGVTTKWLTAVPSSGNTSSVDLYSFSIMKTSSGTFTVFASQSKFV